MRLRSFSVLCCVVGLFCTSLIAQAQSSTPTSPTPPIPPTLSDPLWQTLLPLITSLPANFKAYQDNLTSQANSLRQTMLGLQQDNASLTASLAISQALESTLEGRSTQLQTDLDASTASTTQIKEDLRKAQGDARALEAQVSILRVGCITLGVGLGAIAVYEGGRVLHLW